jgi:hypothetical protein
MADPFKLTPTESMSQAADQRRDPLYFIDRLNERHTPLQWKNIPPELAYCLS